MLFLFIHSNTYYNIMDKGQDILQTIMLLQQYDKPKKLPMYHYAFDYTLTAIFLSLYAWGIYSIISWIWA